MGNRIKYDYAFRLQCVEAVLTKGCSARSVAEALGFREGNLRRWIGLYERYGPQSLESKANRHYTSTFKLHVLETMQKEALSLRGASVRFNIPSESVVSNWRKIYQLKGAEGFIAQPKGQFLKMKQPIKRKTKKTDQPLTREEELMLENEYLRMENELLKKLQALTQARKKQKP